MSKTSLQFQTISFIRFPLIIGVVLAHSHIVGSSSYGFIPRLEESVCVFNIQFLVSFVLAKQGVPLFALISGFLFFLNNSLTLGEYKTKLKRRVNSLFVPYILWNGALVLFYLLLRNIPEVVTWYYHGEHKVTALTAKKIISFFWNSNNGAPINFQFWFVRDLMIVILFSPLVKLFVVKCKYWGVILLTLFWMFQYDLNFTFFNIRAVFFFTVGAYFAINKLNLVEEFRKLFKVSALVYPMVVVAEICTVEMPINDYIHNLGLLVGGVFFFNLVAYLLEKGKLKVNKFLTSATFFVFAAHEPLLTLVKKVTFKLIHPIMEWQLIVLYFAIPTITILICLGTYYLLARYTPRVARVLTGRW